MKSFFAFLFVAIIVAAAPPVSPDTLIRDGNAAFARMDNESAIRLYKEAEERGTDPGLIAFNKATALYHLKKYDDAETHYRRALDDDQIAPERRVRALYNLGNCLIQEVIGKELKAASNETQLTTLKSAVVIYEMCLETPSDDATLREDAMHNLELAKLLWSKTRRQSRAKEPPTPNEGPEPETEKQRPPESVKKEPQGEEAGDPEHQDPNSKNGGTSNQQKQDVGVKMEKKDLHEPRKSDLPPPPGPGKMQVINDVGQIQEMSQEKTEDFLKKTEKRLVGERKLIREASAIEGRRGIEKDY
jgi:tetratricopeptide (TPR) repeat protein